MPPVSLTTPRLSWMIPGRLVARSWRMSVQIFLTLLGVMSLPQAASAEHICGGRSDEYVVSEVFVAGGGVVESWCEWSSKGDGNSAAAMRYYSPEEWKAFAEHGAQAEAANAEERRLAAQRYRQLQQGVWFMPGEQPFAGWSSAEPASARHKEARKDCTVSYWTIGGAVIMSAGGGASDQATIRYMGYSIPLPSASQTRKFSLTQSGETQTVKALISRAGLGKRKMGMVSFVVPSADLLVRSIEDDQDYVLSEDGKAIFAGRWHDGLKARDALARCLAQRD